MTASKASLAVGAASNDVDHKSHACLSGRDRSIGAEGETAPETLRQQDRWG